MMVREWCGEGVGGTQSITSFPRRRESYDAHIFTTPPTPSSRHSRASRALPSAPLEPSTQIPAYAGMTSKDAITGMTGEERIYDLEANLHDRGNGAIPCGALLGVVR